MVDLSEAEPCAASFAPSVFSLYSMVKSR
jgi:hypothetical protein